MRIGAAMLRRLTVVTGPVRRVSLPARWRAHSFCFADAPIDGLRNVHAQLFRRCVCGRMKTGRAYQWHSTAALEFAVQPVLQQEAAEFPLHCVLHGITFAPL